MKMKFKDVPTGCRISYWPGTGRSVFNGTKIDVDAAQRVFPERGFMFNIQASEVVTVVFNSPWRVSLHLLGDKVGSQRLCKALQSLVWNVVMLPSTLLYKVANYGLTRGEINALYEEMRPLTERVRYAKLQERYDEAFNTRSIDTTSAAPSPDGLVGLDGFIKAPPLRCEVGR